MLEAEIGFFVLTPPNNPQVPRLLTTLDSLQATLDSRTSLYAKMTKLGGRLDMVLNQIQISRAARAEEEAADEPELGVWDEEGMFYVFIDCVCVVSYVHGVLTRFADAENDMSVDSDEEEDEFQHFNEEAFGSESDEDERMSQSSGDEDVDENDELPLR